MSQPLTLDRFETFEKKIFKQLAELAKRGSEIQSFGGITETGISDKKGKKLCSSLKLLLRISIANDTLAKITVGELK